MRLENRERRRRKKPDDLTELAPGEKTEAGGRCVRGPLGCEKYLEPRTNTRPSERFAGSIEAARTSEMHRTTASVPAQESDGPKKTVDVDTLVELRVRKDL